MKDMIIPEKPKCHICHQVVVYPNGVYGRNAKRIYHKECIKAQRKERIKEK